MWHSALGPRQPGWRRRRPYDPADAPVAQWSERLPSKQRVAGSSPAGGAPHYVRPVRPLRFGLQLGRGDVPSLVEQARRAEAVGFDIVLVGDHLDDGPSPLGVLAGVAAATSTIRLGTLVLNADWYEPALLAREVATLDHLSGGRFELGLGAGHTPQELATAGRTFDPPAVRKARLAELVEIVRDLLDGGAVTFDGVHHRVRGLRTLASAQAHLPLLVAGRGEALLSHAARHADVIGLAGLGRTLPDGHRHEVRWSISALEADLAIVRAAAGGPWADLELNVLVQVVRRTDDRRAAADVIAGAAPGLTVDDALATPYLALGTPEEMAEQILTARDRWGISYVVVRDADAFLPALCLLRDAEGAGGGASGAGDGRAQPPEGYRTVTPRLVVEDLDATVAFLRAAFGATGEIHPGRPVELRLGDSTLLVGQAGERDRFPAFLYIYVDDADATYARAVEAGATSVEVPVDTPYGDRRAMVRDPAGNVFQVAHPLS